MRNIRLSVQSVVAVAVAAMALLLGLVLFTAPFAKAASTIQITSPSGTEGCQLANTITVTGTATADAPPGQLEQYAIQVDWGDTTQTNGIREGDFGSGHGSGGPLTFSSTHLYTAPGTYTITTRIYHSQPPGNDNQADSVDSVQVCIISPLTITKTADTSFTRSHAWSIDKTADQTNLTLADGQLFSVNYGVAVNTTPTDSNWSVSGNISISNPAGNPTVSITGVTDNLSTDGAATVTCPGGLPHSLAPGATYVCTYTKSLSAGTNQTNTASVTTNMAALNGSSSAVPVTFGSPTTSTDECISVTDTYAGGPQAASVCAGVDTLPKTFNYSVSFGKAAGANVLLVCGTNPAFTNTASFVSNDTATTGNDSWTVNSTVACIPGCTLTQGYWKTRNASFKGGAPVDDNWASVGGPGAPFFTSEQTWFQVFWTAPKGNAYYNLAHQYMAAVLNVNNGAGAPANVASAITTSAGLFGTYSPAQIAALKGNSTLRQQFLSLAGTLGSFNEGTIGPGHCSEQNPPQSNTLTFTATNSSYYNGPTNSDPLYATGPFSFTWNTITGAVTGGYYTETSPPVSGTTYYNMVTGGTVVGSTVNLIFSRTNPNIYGFTGSGTLSGNTFTGTLDGPYYFTATGTVAP